jgi:hypothetical protein
MAFTSIARHAIMASHMPLPASAELQTSKRHQHACAATCGGRVCAGRIVCEADAATARHEEIFMPKPEKKSRILFDMNAEHGG